MQYALAALVGLAFGFVAGCLLEPLFWPAFLLIAGILVVEASFPWAGLGCCAALLAALMASIVSGRAPRHANEALIGLSLAHARGLSVGDELQVSKSDGEERTYIVSGLLSSVLNGGQWRQPYS